MHGSAGVYEKFTAEKAGALHIGCTATHFPRESPMKIFQSDLFRSFGIGFGAVAFALVMTRFDGAEALIAVVQ